MSIVLPDGIWPTMLTPFNHDGSLDLESLKKLIDWYIENGAAGLFAVCQSSEMFYLTLREKKELADATVAFAAGRVPVICSGHTADSFEDQRSELSLLADSGADALVLVTNRLAGPQQGDETMIATIDRIVDSLPPDTSFGLYECPYPYKRLLSQQVLTHCRDTGRFVCLKDTSCSEARIKKRLELLNGSPLKLYNANAATLLQSLNDGAAGYCGVMANFFPRLYRDLVVSADTDPGRAALLQEWAGPLSLLEKGGYPVNAKVFLQKRGLIETTFTRATGTGHLDEYLELILEQVYQLSKQIPQATEKEII